MTTEPPIRDDAWLEERLRILRDVHFSDLPQGYPIVVRFARRGVNRLGCITARNRQAVIMVNRLFTLPEVPAFIVDATLAHELAHYAHGFGSGLPRRYADPHRGGVVERELESRGLGLLYERAKLWHEVNWDEIQATHCADLNARRDRRAEEADSLWTDFLNRPNARSLAELEARWSAIESRFGGQIPGVRVAWLRSSRQQASPSYWHPSVKTIELCGLLTDRRVPDCVVDFELGYWRARLAVGSDNNAVKALLSRRGLDPTVACAIEWRRLQWDDFREANHPLIAGPD